MATYRSNENGQPLRTDDLLRSAISRAVHTNFLNDSELVQYVNVLKRSNKVSYDCLGGYDEAERKILSAYPFGEMAPDSPVFCIRVTDNSGMPLTHRDYLGALMSLGVKRELIGDIVVDERGAFIFCTELMSKLIVMELTKVGNHGVKAEYSDASEMRPRQPERRVINVNSMRIDCVLAAAINKNRELCKQLVESGSVKINGVEINKPSRELSSGDSFYAKGFGKFKAGEQLGKSAKDRLFVELYTF